MNVENIWKILGQGLATLSFTLALAAADVAGATAVRTSARSLSMPSTRQILSARHDVWSLRGGVAYTDAKAAGYSAYLYRLRFSTGKIHRRNAGCKPCIWNGDNMASAAAPAVSGRPATATVTPFALPTPPSGNFIVAPTGASGVLVADILFVRTEDPSPVRVAGTNIAGLASGLIWRSSSFSVAGSRVWSKLIKFSSCGINVRVPLN